MEPPPTLLNQPAHNKTTLSTSGDFAHPFRGNATALDLERQEQLSKSIRYNVQRHHLLKAGVFAAKTLATRCTFFCQYVPKTLADRDVVIAFQSFGDRMSSLLNKMQKRRIRFIYWYAHRLVKELKDLSLHAESLVAPIIAATMNQQARVVEEISRYERNLLAWNNAPS